MNSLKISVNTVVVAAAVVAGGVLLPIDAVVGAVSAVAFESFAAPEGALRSRKLSDAVASRGQTAARSLAVRLAAAVLAAELASDNVLANGSKGQRVKWPTLAM